MNLGVLATLIFNFQDSSQALQSSAPAALQGSDTIWLWIALSVGVLALIAAFILARVVLAGDTGTPDMRVISDAIREGAEAFLSRQYRSIGIMAVVLAVIIFLGYYFSPNTRDVAVQTVIAFLVGATCSGLAGFTGMYVSIRANIRTAAAARTSLNGALQSALRGGAVTGLVVVALALIGIGVLFLAFGGLNNPQHVVYELVGFGFGASLVALFAQLGGGIYTKAADVGADLVGKVEAGIPEDDPRNPAVIADLVGDNVGDCAGRGADIFESTAAENVGAMILGAALYPVFGIKGILFPLMVHAINLVASIIGVAVVKTTDSEDPMRALNRGFYVTSILALAGFAGIVYKMLNGPGVQPLYLFLCGVIGLVTAFLFVWITQYYTESPLPPRPVHRRSLPHRPRHQHHQRSRRRHGNPRNASQSSSAPPFSSATTAASRASRASTSPASPTTSKASTAPPSPPWACSPAPPTSSPWTPSAPSPTTPAASSKCPTSPTPSATRPTSSTPPATPPRPSPRVTPSAPPHSPPSSSSPPTSKRSRPSSPPRSPPPAPQATCPHGWSFTNVNLAEIPVFAGAMLGAMLVYLFSSMAIKAVGRTAQMVVKDVRDQFRENPGIMAGTSKPDYARCVSIVTGAALKEMVLPGILAVGLPVAVGLIFRNFSSVYGAGTEVLTAGGFSTVPTINGIPVNLGGATAVAGLLMVGTITGVLLAMLMNNGGGAWDNAKKWIETGKYGGKKSDAHKAAVVGDTVGDPFKDTAGPSLHVLIKLLATITLVLAPLFL